MKRDPAGFLVFVEALGRGIHFVFKTDITDVGQHKQGIEAGASYLRKRYRLTDEELSGVKLDPRAKCVLAVDQSVWSDFYPVVLPVNGPQEGPVVSDARDDSVTMVKAEQGQPPANLLLALQAEQQQAVSRQEVEQEYNEQLPTTAHEHIIRELLKQIVPVDFRELAINLNPSANHDDYDTLRVSDYHVLVAEQILFIARERRWHFCRRHAFFYLFNGEFWRVIDKDDLRRFLAQAAESMGIKWLMARSVNFTKQLFDQFNETAYLPAPVTNRNRVLISLLNGTFEISPDKQQLRQPNPEDFITHQLNFSYDPLATAPLFDQFLHRVQPDADCRKLLAEYLGYVFVSPSMLKMEKALLLYGSGANGKSVFFEIIMGLLGSENVSNYSFEKLTTDPAYRAQIANKLLNYASEISGNLDSTIFKALSSAEPVEARLLYGQAFTMTDYAKLMANTNELPVAPEHTHAYFRRFLIVPFLVTIPEAEQDKQLANKIIASELPGIFNWILSGLRRLLVQGQFTDSKVVRDQLEQYQNQSDTVRLFLDEHHWIPDSEAWKSLQDLYREYRSYCTEDGYRAVKKLNFRKRLEANGYQVDDRNIGKIVFLKQR